MIKAFIGIFHFLIFFMAITKLIILYVPNYLRGQPLPEGSDFFLLDDFSGGLNTQFSSPKKPSNFAEKIKNLYIDETPGSLVRRKGWEIVNTTSTLTKVNFMFSFNRENGDKEFIVSDGSRVLSTKDFIAYTFIRDGLSGIILQAAQVRDKVWITNGFDEVFTWDGTTGTILNGTGGTPTAPRGKYIAYYHERVWLFSTNLNKSALHFTALTSTNGNAIAPDTSDAFPSDNQLNIGQGDGQNGAGLFVHRGSLFPVKERSIFTVVGDNEFNYFTRKTDSEIGFVSQDSIKILDGLVYGLAKDGIYQFDGNNSQRISDLIAPDIEKINKKKVATSIITWLKKTDFERGRFSGSTVPVNSLTLYTGTRSITNIPELASISNMNTFTASTAAVIAIDSGLLEPSYNGIPDFMVIGSSRIGDFTAEFTVRNAAVCGKNVSPTENEPRYYESGSCFGGFPSGATDSIILNSQDIIDRKLSVRFEPSVSGVRIAGFPWRTYPDSNRGARIILSPATTGQFISDISTFTDATVWGTFDTKETIIDGNIKYFVRSSTAINIVEQQVWSSIISGSVLDLSTGNLFVQWASTISSISRTNPPVIDSVIINYIKGDPDDSPIFAQTWKNRYWLLVTTEVTKDFPLIYVKSKITNPNPNAWMTFDNHLIRSFGEFSDNFYAGSSTAGTIIKLDIGFKDKESAIDSVYETPVLQMSNRFFEKKLSEYMIDTEQSGISDASLKIGISVDGRAFEDTSFDISGSTRIIKISSQINKFGKSFRFRIRENTSKSNFVFNSLLGIFQPTTIRRQ